MCKGFEPLLARLSVHYFLNYSAIAFLLPSSPIFSYLPPPLCLPIELRSTDPHFLVGLETDNYPCCSNVLGVARQPSCSSLFHVGLLTFNGYPRFVLHISSGLITQANCRFSIYCFLLFHMIIPVLRP
jgi:hypothetical protein